MRRKYYIVLAAGMLLSLSSCSDSFLDKNPDERTEINTPEKVTSLLVSAYPDNNPATICEFSSDNIIDNNAHHSYWDREAGRLRTMYYNLNSYSRADDEAFKFEPIVSSTQQDSPTGLWSSYYHAIATANHALRALDEIAAQNGGVYTPQMNASKGEALMIRAFSHFMLVNIFSQAYKDSVSSKADVGVPYVTQVEDKVLVHYDRSNVAEVYKKIKQDLEEALPLITDQYYTQPKWHFNVKAAHAFASRFYLFTRDYDKVIEHANAVLGTDPSTLPSQLINYSTFAKDQNLTNYVNHWAGSDVSNNIMLIDTYSNMWLHVAGGRRYSHNAEAAHATINRTWPTCDYTVLPATISSGLYKNGNQDYGLVWARNCGPVFQYEDRQAGIGYYHVIRTEFTNTEVLLNRAEAELLCSRHDSLAALADIQAIENSRQTTSTYNDGFSPLTKALVDRYWTYPGDRNAKYNQQRAGQSLYESWDFTQNMSSSFVVPKDCEKWMNLIQDYRRTEMLFSGMRFFDLKRFGIEYTHVYGPDDVKYTLKWNDPRRAIEVPADALAAGLESSRPATAAETPTKVSSSYIQKTVK
ncbi:MAG: RagB/SusD family nutrient uptake outer membrane protein [Prevotella sp.]|nr:RagB/SusD family nutrient uptake outer membrane protein [Prevotella sp.]